MKTYIKSLTVKDILTVLFSSLMQLSLYFFMVEFELNKYFFITVSLIILCSVVLSHRFYFLEHKQRNRLWGRIFHDMMIATVTISFLIFFLNSTGTFYKIGFYSNLITIVLFTIFTAEAILSVINRILLKVRWEIW